MPSTYTFTSKTPPTVGASNFGGQVNDANHNAMAGGSGIQTVDITGTPLVSPLTVSNSVVSSLLIPLNATQVTFITTTNTLKVSESNNAVTTNFFTIPVGTVVTLPVARMSVLYLLANTGSATVNFFFTII